MTFKKFIKNEIEGWKKLEVTWLLIACAVIVGLSIYWDDTVMGIISSTTGGCTVRRDDAQCAILCAYAVCWILCVVKTYE